MAKKAHHGITEQRKAALHRWEDARVLLRGGRWQGAMYLAGYTIECRLKRKLMEIFRCRNLRELESELGRRRTLQNDFTVYTHQLVLLLQLTGASDRLRRSRDMRSTFNHVNRWIPAWRYSPNSSNHDDATDFLASVERVMNWIEHNI